MYLSFEAYDLQEEAMPDFTAQEVLDRAVQAALEYFDQGNRTAALAAFLSEIGEHEGTRHIQSFPMTIFILGNGYERGRHAFEDAMRGFAIHSNA